MSLDNPSVPIALAMVMGHDFIYRREQDEVEMVGTFQSLSVRNFPFELPCINIYLELTDAQGDLEGKIQCLGIDGRLVFESRPHSIRFGNPMQVVKAMFRIQNCRFPRPGTYRIRFLCEDEVVTERRLVLLKRER